MKHLFLIALALIALSACTTKTEDLKSPCVGIEGSPCGPKRSANPDKFTV